MMDNETPAEYAIVKLFRLTEAGVVDDGEQLDSLIAGLHWSAEEDFSGTRRPTTVAEFLSRDEAGGIPLAWKDGNGSYIQLPKAAEWINECVSSLSGHVCRGCWYEAEQDAAVHHIWNSDLPKAWKKAYLMFSKAPEYANYI